MKFVSIRGDITVYILLREIVISNLWGGGGTHTHGGRDKMLKNVNFLLKIFLVTFLCIFEVPGNVFMLQKFRGQNIIPRKKKILKMPFVANFEGSHGGGKKRAKNVVKTTKKIW